MTIDILAKEVLEANLALVRHHLVVFTSGNASAIDRDYRDQAKRTLV